MHGCACEKLPPSTYESINEKRGHLLGDQNRMPCLSMLQLKGSSQEVGYSLFGVLEFGSVHFPHHFRICLGRIAH